MNDDRELSVRVQRQNLFMCLLASVKSLNATANSGDYSNLILDKLQEKWAEDQAAVACVWQEQSVLS